MALLGGEDEGAFQWLTLNYLMGTLDEAKVAVRFGLSRRRRGGFTRRPVVDPPRLQHTVAVIDLGGGSVQVAHALSDAAASAAPPGCALRSVVPRHSAVSADALPRTSYVRELRAGPTTWHVYVHSYLGYGLMAARAAVLKAGPAGSGALLNATSDASQLAAADAAAQPHACLPAFVAYEYAGERVSAAAASAPVASSGAGCAAAAVRALRLAAPCAPAPAGQCAFAGAWGGGGGEGAASFVASSYLWDRAAAAGLVPPTPKGGEEPLDAEVTPAQFAAAAEAACAGDGEAPSVLRALMPGAPDTQPDAALFCLDLSYCATLLHKGFARPPEQPIKIVRRVRHRGQPVEAAWPLGAALNALG